MPRENKTKLTKASPAKYLKAIQDEARRKDCETLTRLMTKLTKEQPRMWGPSIVGFGSYHYKYDSGREGDMCLTGFSSRKEAIAVYLTEDLPGRDRLLAKLGKHKMGKACLYINNLRDVDLTALEGLIAGSIAERKRLYG